MADVKPFLTRDALLAAAKQHAETPTIDTMDVPGLGSVGIKHLKASELDELYRWANARVRAEKRKHPGKKITIPFRGMVLVRTLVDSEGARIFTDDDLAIFDDLGAGVILPVIKKAQQVNGIIDAPKDDDDADDEDTEA